MLVKIMRTSECSFAHFKDKKNSLKRFISTITIMTYKLKPGFLSFDALSYNETLLQEVCIFVL